MIETAITRDAGPNVRARVDPELKAIAVAQLEREGKTITDVIVSALLSVVEDAPQGHRYAARTRLDEAIEILGRDTAARGLNPDQVKTLRDVRGHLADAKLALAELISHG